VSAYPTHRIKRWEYDLAESLLVAIIEDDREQFDVRVASADASEAELSTDIMVIALAVAEAVSRPWVSLRRHPSAQAKADLVDGLRASAFADVVDIELAQVIVHRLHQRAFRDPVVAPTDYVSMTTALMVAAWMLWNGRAPFPRDRFVRAMRTFRSVARVMRLRRAQTYEWWRHDPPDNMA